MRLERPTQLEAVISCSISLIYEYTKDLFPVASFLLAVNFPVKKKNYDFHLVSDDRKFGFLMHAL